MSSDNFACYLPLRRLFFEGFGFDGCLMPISGATLAGRSGTSTRSNQFQGAEVSYSTAVIGNHGHGEPVAIATQVDVAILKFIVVARDFLPQVASNSAI